MPSMSVVEVFFMGGTHVTCESVGGGGGYIHHHPRSNQADYFFHRQQA